jgi:hypothetical protein
MEDYMNRSLIIALFSLTMLAPALAAQGTRLASPAGVASTEIRGKYKSGVDEPEYEGGKWIEIAYGRPIKRGRDLWGAGADYGKMLDAGAPVWRAGANQTTRLKTELPLVIGGKTIAPGEYDLFIDLKPGNWTLIVSTWPAQTTYDPRNTSALWGSFGYTPAKDVARAPMALGTLPMAIDQMTWAFTDMSDAGGKLTIMWDKMIASVPFTVGR